MSIASAVTTVVESIAIPYGYTLAIWSAGTLAIIKYGLPQPRHVLFFVAGAMLGYMIFDIPVWISVASNPTVSVRLPSIALLNLFPMVTSVISSQVISGIRNKGAAFLLTGFTATVVYILSLSFLIATITTLTQ